MSSSTSLRTCIESSLLRVNLNSEIIIPFCQQNFVLVSPHSNNPDLNVLSSY